MLFRSEHYPFHMPGHKRQWEVFNNVNPYQIDITEIDGFDDLHHASGCIQHSQERTAEIFGAEETHYLINGCTGGILAAILGCCNMGDEILVDRSSHKSVFHAIMLQGLQPQYIWSGHAGITAKEVLDCLEKKPRCKCVVVTSPTYEGMVSDIKGIAEVVHSFGIPLIVDEAHGAHFHFHKLFPEDSLSLGADVVIHGIHKTLPALTQTALLHLNGKIVNRKAIKKYLSIFQTSSPSYVLMGSIDQCMEFITEKGDEFYGRYAERLQRLYHELSELQHLYLLPYNQGRDASKIVVCTERSAISGRECYNKLREEYHLQPEMCSLEYTLLMTSVLDTDAACDRLIQALQEIDCGSTAVKTRESLDDESFSLPYQEGDFISEMIYVYPPGIPLVLPGEYITKESIDKIKEYIRQGFTVHGL